jgi:hypothetical protein
MHFVRTTGPLKIKNGEKQNVFCREKTMKKYTLKFDSTESGDLQSQGRSINGVHYLISEEGKADVDVRTNAYVALTTQIRASKQPPKKGKLEITLS